MNSNLKRIISAIIFFVMLLSFTFPLSSCGGNGDGGNSGGGTGDIGGGDVGGGGSTGGDGTGGDGTGGGSTDSTQPTKATYTVTVKSLYGMLTPSVPRGTYALPHAT